MPRAPPTAILIGCLLDISTSTFARPRYIKAGTGGDAPIQAGIDAPVLASIVLVGPQQLPKYHPR
jgi:hypothetical protein